ncbi:MAG: class I SAM-dependent methyltransferase [Gammaproteobacteria bacterium]|nr:class I SAM-dependent methyltransferase [Gammaproteobacteria bacterium]MDH5778601.1 class I SAM-dependent methyltransferase [Gammaproteobacteria bacterium]
MNNELKWVRESDFGTWFLSTDTWVNFVLRKALDDLEHLFPERKPSYQKIMDVGCGFGHSLVELDKRFDPQQLIGLDVDPDVPARAQINADQCHAKVEFLTSNAEAIALPDASLDMIFCHQTFHHIVGQEQAVKEFYRLLKPGGVLLFAESCRRFIHSLIIKVLFRHPMDVQKTAEEYVDLLQQTGFQIKPEQISHPYLWWSRWDLGVLEKMGLVNPKKPHEETMVNVIAVKPD